MTSRVTILHDDCIAAMARLAPESVNVVVTSPPYNLDIKYATYRDDRPLAEYLEWTGRWMAEVLRVLAPNGSFFLNVSGSPSQTWRHLDIAQVARGLGLRLQNEIIWVKSIHIADHHTFGHVKPINSTRYLNNTHEYIYHFTRTGSVPLSRYGAGVGVPFAHPSNLVRWGHNRERGCGGNTWHIPYRTIQNKQERAMHPATFPVELPLRCLRLAGAVPGWLALDPFGGIGSTASACREVGVDVISIDMDGEYCRVAAERTGTGVGSAETLDVVGEYAQLRPGVKAVLHLGDSARFLEGVPAGSLKLIVSSPPYNLNKEYERRQSVEAYLAGQAGVIDRMVRACHPEGSICWQVGNYIEDGEVFPLDYLFHDLFKKQGLKLRNRIIWRFDHGLHAQRRFSGRYETLLWFTKGDHYTFNLDPVRVPSKYPGKRHFKGDHKGQPSCNPLGKNPSDFWDLIRSDWHDQVWDIPNVKANHVEKTGHPCQFPIELVERCVLALTEPGDLVYDPYSGTASTALAAVKHDRIGLGSEVSEKYHAIATSRMAALLDGTLRMRPLGKPVHTPSGRVARIPEEWTTDEDRQNEAVPDPPPRL